VMSIAVCKQEASSMGLNCGILGDFYAEHFLLFSPYFLLGCCLPDDRAPDDGGYH